MGETSEIQSFFRALKVKFLLLTQNQHTLTMSKWINAIMWHWHKWQITCSVKYISDTQGSPQYIIHLYMSPTFICCRGKWEVCWSHWPWAHQMMQPCSCHQWKQNRLSRHLSSQILTAHQILGLLWQQAWIWWLMTCVWLILHKFSES